MFLNLISISTRALDFHVPEAIHMLFPDLCFLDPSLCDQVFDLLFGPSLNLNNSRLSYYVTYEPNPTSTKNIAHWAQGVRSGAFCKYDYGYQGNMRVSFKCSKIKNL